jgi:hypothetical protein
MIGCLRAPLQEFVMALGKITSLLSSLSPASDAAAAAPEETPQDTDRRTEALSDQSGLANDGQRGTSSDIAAQLQTMVGAVRILNENALQQGAAVAVSQAGGELKNAVSGLGHLLSAVSAQALANGAAAPVREASKVIDGVEAGLAGSQAAAEQLIRNLPAAQSQRAQEASDKFQADMRAAITQVRGALGSLNVRN